MLLPGVLGPFAAAGAQTRVEESSSLDHAATVAGRAALRVLLPGPAAA